MSFSQTVLSGAEEWPGGSFQILLRTCQARNLKIAMVWIYVCEMCANLMFRITVKQGTMIADKNGNRLESRKLRTAPGYDAGPHVLWPPTVLYHPLSLIHASIIIITFYTITFCTISTANTYASQHNTVHMYMYTDTPYTIYIQV